MPVTSIGHAMPVVTILMADAGGGHRAAARSLAEALDGRAQVYILNLLDDYTPFPFNQLSPTYGPWVNHSPWLYHLFYRSTEARRPVELGERAAYPLVRKRLGEAFAQVWPDLVISVHPLLTGLPLRVLRDAGNFAPFVTVVTDPVTVHPAWFCPDVDLCVVATEEARLRAISSGMDPSRVVVIGLPVRRGFWQRPVEPKPAIRQRLGVTPDLPMVLLTGGGAGIGKVLPLARAIARRVSEAGIEAQLAIIAGHNRELLKRLQRAHWPIPVTPLGYVEAMADWLAASDLLVSKAGPGTLAEAACMGVPVLVTGYIPGQETGNVDWIQNNRAGAFITEPKLVGTFVADLLQPGNPELPDMARRAESIARPDATVQIANRALALYHGTSR